jgi:hypothetical protein
MDDYVTPNYWKIAMNGGIVNNHLYKYRHVIDGKLGLCSYYFMQQRQLGCPGQLWTDYTPHNANGFRDLTALSLTPYLDLSFSDAEKQSAKDLAITEAWARISQADVQSLVIMKEADKTVRGLTILLKRVYRIALSVWTGNLKLFLKEISFKELQDIYMTARYELRPLYYDVRGLYKAISPHEQLDRSTSRGSTVISSSDSVTEMVPVRDLSAALGLLIEAPLYKSVKLEYSVRAGVLSKWTASLGNNLGLSEIPESVWEIIPYSFIIDWFCNVGDYVSSWSPNIGATTLASWVVMKETKIQKTTVGTPVITKTTGTIGRTIDEVASATGSIYQLTEVTTREPYTSRPIMPRVEVKLDMAKILDLSIIIRNLRRGLSRTLRL